MTKDTHVSLSMLTIKQIYQCLPLKQMVTLEIKLTIKTDVSILTNSKHG